MQRDSTRPNCSRRASGPGRCCRGFVIAKRLADRSRPGDRPLLGARPAAPAIDIRSRTWDERDGYSVVEQAGVDNAVASTWR